ncbi:MAG: hypothetical protein COA50_03495 [Flavobacteriaceae bacterium]|nr:MAG: hypothetical protein COA50_03495 [Flavobacteriaceae bacterium]
MDSIANQVKKIIADKELTYKNNQKVKKLIETAKLYDSLVASGITVKRGNTLLSRTKVHICSVKQYFTAF